MAEALNLSAVHTNGTPQLTIGIRGKSFNLSLDSENKKVILIDPLTKEKLSLEINDIITEKIYAQLALLESTSTTGDELVVMNADKTLSPTTLSVASIQSAIEEIDKKADKAITLGGYGIKNAYTKTEIDRMLTSAMTFKGSYESFQSLLDAVSSSAIIPSAGWVFNIRIEGGVDDDGIAIKAGDNVVYNGDGWDCLGGSFDTSLFATSAQFEALSGALTALTTTVSDKADKATTISGYGITDAYTKSEVDGKLTSAVHYKGTVATYTALPSSPEIGDVYNITSAGGTDSKGTPIKAGDNVAYSSSGWDVLGGTTDLSAYSTTTEMNSAISSAISGKANSATTLGGYGITNAYTKTEVDNALATKANTSTTYTKTEVDSTVATINTTLGTKANTSAVPTVTVSTSAPTSSATGKTGDLWIVYTA